MVERVAQRTNAENNIKKMGFKRKCLTNPDNSIIHQDTDKRIEADLLTLIILVSTLLIGLTKIYPRTAADIKYEATVTR